MSDWGVQLVLLRKFDWLWHTAMAVHASHVVWMLSMCLCFIDLFSWHGSVGVPPSAACSFCSNARRLGSVCFVTIQTSLWCCSDGCTCPSSAAVSFFPITHDLRAHMLLQHKTSLFVLSAIATDSLRSHAVKELN